MNEELIMKMAEPNIKNGILTYELFDKIYGMLSRKEQYQVCEILNNNGIQLADVFDDEDIASSIEDLPEPEESFDVISEGVSIPLFDDSIFKDSKSGKEYVYYSKDVKQSNDTLIRLIKEGNKQARQDICIKNEGLVRKYVNIYYRYFGNDLDVEDLLQAGYIGVLTAADNFDFSKESAFSTYAIYWIKQSISRLIYEEGYRIRIPVHMMEKISRMTRLDNQYGSEGMDYQQRIKHIAADMETTEEKVEEWIEIKHQFLSGVSLDTPVGEEEETPLGEFIPADKSYNVEDQVFQSSLSSALDEILSSLNQREEKILRLRYGLYDGHPKTLEEVGKEFGVTRERIRQIEAKALRKLRHPTKTRKIKDYIID